MRRSVRDFQLKGIRRQKRGDRIVRYHRASGVRLPDDIPETHPDFIAAWARAEAGQPAGKAAAVVAGSLSAACIGFAGSAEYRRQSPVYRAILKRHMDAIREQYGAVAIKAVKAKHINADLSKLEGTRPQARLKTWRKVMAHAVQIGMIDEDPSAAVRAKAVKTQGHAAWSADDIAAFRGRWPIGTVQRACFELVFWTGARTVDAVAIGPQHIGRDGVLTYRQRKTSGLAYVPWSCTLPPWANWQAERADMIEALRVLSGGLTFLQTHGRSRSEKGLSNLISAAARGAGLEARTAHGLRKSRLTAIAEAGGSAHAIKAWGGHATLAEAAHYTASADAKRLLIGTEQEQNAVSPAERDTKTR